MHGERREGDIAVEGAMWIRFVHALVHGLYHEPKKADGETRIMLNDHMFSWFLGFAVWVCREVARLGNDGWDKNLHYVEMRDEVAKRLSDLHQRNWETLEPQMMSVNHFDAHMSTRRPTNRFHPDKINLTNFATADYYGIVQLLKNIDDVRCAAQHLLHDSNVDADSERLVLEQMAYVVEWFDPRSEASLGMQSRPRQRL